MIFTYLIQFKKCPFTSTPLSLNFHGKKRSSTLDYDIIGTYFRFFKPKTNDMAKYYDIHAHVFNKNVLIRRLVNVVQSLIDICNSEDIGSANHKIESIILNLEDLTQPESEDVFDILDTAYEKDFVITPLMLDLTYADDNDGSRAKDRRYRRRIRIVFKAIKRLIPIARGFVNEESKITLNRLKEEVKELEKKINKKSATEVELFDDANYVQQIVDLEALVDKYDHVKPFFGVDPRREYKEGVNLIDKITEKVLSPHAKFTGIKLYAPVGFSPTDPVLMGTSSRKGVYELCQKNNIPITVHCSDSGFACLSTNLKINGHININGAILKAPKKPFNFKYKFLGLKVSKAIHERAYTLNHPRIWEKVLKKYPNLTLNLAHFGGSGPVMDYVKYRIRAVKIDKDDFEESISHLSKRDQDTIQAAYTKKWGKMHLNEHMSLEQRAKVWNAMYRAGLVDNWTKAIFDIIKNPKYPNVYSDLSCFSDGKMVDIPDDGTENRVFSVEESLNTFKSSFYDKLTDYERSKFLYGSDYFLIHFFGATMKQYLADFKNAFGDEFDDIAKKHPERFLFGAEMT